MVMSNEDKGHKMAHVKQERVFNTTMANIEAQENSGASTSSVTDSAQMDSSYPASSQYTTKEGGNQTKSWQPQNQSGSTGKSSDVGASDGQQVTVRLDREAQEHMTRGESIGNGYSISNVDFNQLKSAKSQKEIFSQIGMLEKSDLLQVADQLEVPYEERNSKDFIRGQIYNKILGAK